MKIQTLERRIQTAARDLQLEIAMMEHDGPDPTR